MEEKVLVRNDVLIDQVLGFIEQNPQEWEQGVWFCDTAACFAGHALLLSGYRIIDTTVEKAKNAHLLSWIDHFEMVNPDNDIVSEYGDLAQKLLGIRVDQANDLFSDDIHGIEELRQVIDDIRTES